MVTFELKFVFFAVFGLVVSSEDQGVQDVSNPKTTNHGSKDNGAISRAEKTGSIRKSVVVPYEAISKPQTRIRVTSEKKLMKKRDNIQNGIRPLLPEGGNLKRGGRTKSGGDFVESPRA